ncbi:MAG: GDSL-type esterase/lipase family protein, partial [Rikenellaceae bacterium]
WAGCCVFEKANQTAPRGAKAVFIGNSITEGWMSKHEVFFTENGYIGRGIGGQVSSQMLSRFHQDVVDLKPKAVVILAGTNDIARNNGYISLKNIFNNIVSMVEIAKSNKIKVVLCSIVPASKFGWRKELSPAEDIKAMNVMIKKYAKDHKIPYVDYHSALTDENGGLPLKYAADGVHPNVDGYLIMESLVKPVLDKL